jgi:tetratricopeptide (TPR) repeat protein
MTKKITYLFWIILLGVFIRLSLDAGISGDEYLHLRHSYYVVNYYKTLGQDRSCMHTPKTFLKYYGQSYDNFATLISEIFGIEDIFTLRHILNAIAGWLIVLFTWLTAKYLSNKRTAMIAVVLLLISPRFIGHSFNNLKDIPFALGFIASLFFLLKYLKEMKSSPFRYKIGLIAAIAFTISIRPGGLLLYAYMWMFAAVRYWQLHRFKLKQAVPEAIPLLYITFTSYFAGLLFWPYALENPLWHPIQSSIVMTDYYVTIRQLFEGVFYWSDQLPWYYLMKYIAITIPVAVIVGAITGIFFVKKYFSGKISGLNMFILLFYILFPILFILLKSSNVYGAWRHVLFIYPPLVIFSAMGISRTTERLKNRYLRYSFSAVILLLLGQPLMFMIRNHPLEIVYFNPLTGGIKGAVGNYEMDYYFHSTRPASEKLIDHLKKTEEKDVIIGGNFETAWFFRNFPAVTKNIYVPVYIRNSKNWDYYILTAAYMTKYSLRPDNWPPENTVFSIDVDDVPICAVLKRETKNDIKAIELVNSGNLDSARVLLEQVISDHPKNLTAHIELGKIYIKMARYLNALNTFRQCLDINPEYEPAFYYLAETQFKSGEKFKAIETLEDLLKINSKYLTGYIKLADYYTDINEFSKAKEVLKKCLKIKPGYKKAVEKLKQLNYK